MPSHVYPQNMYDYGSVSTDPNDRQHKPAIMDGEYPSDDVHMMEQERRRHALGMEGGPLGGREYPHPAHPASPEQYREEMERAAYLRACHGGLPDAPDALPQSPTPFKNMRG